MPDVQPGQDGDPLPDDEAVIRICKKARLSKEGIIHEGLFVPTSDDEKDIYNRISAWAESCTTEEQACSLSNTTIEDALLPRLNAGEVKRLRPEPNTPDVPNLQVEWHPLIVLEAGEPIPDPRPGATGHTGIRDLKIGNKKQRQSLRVQLAALAQRWVEANPRTNGD